MKVAIHGRQFNEQAKPFIQAMFDELARRNVEVQISSVYFELLQQVGIKQPYTSIYTSNQDLHPSDFIFSLGGDGTLLDTKNPSW